MLGFGNLDHFRLKRQTGRQDWSHVTFRGLRLSGNDKNGKKPQCYGPLCICTAPFEVPAPMIRLIGMDTQLETFSLFSVVGVDMDLKRLPWWKLSYRYVGGSCSFFLVS